MQAQIVPSWVVRKSWQGEVQLLKTITYVTVMESRLRKKATPRARFLLKAGRVFGTDLLSTEGGTHAAALGAEIQEEILRELFAEFNGKLWGIGEGSIPPTVIKTPPPEVYRACEEVEFLEQYMRFCAWISTFPRLPFGDSFWHVNSYIVQCLLDGKPTGPEISVSTHDIRESGHWQNYIPRKGDLAHSRTLGTCIIKDTPRVANMSTIYKYIMSTPLQDIRALRIWNVVVVYHRCVLLSRPSESLAETAGSVLSFINEKWRGTHPRNVHQVVCAASIRMAHMRGLGGEDAILASTLNAYFNCTGPEKWHFLTETRHRHHPAADGANGAVFRKVCIQRSVRQDLAPLWLQSTILDLVRWGQLHLCKKIPFPMQFLLPDEKNSSTDITNALTHVSTGRRDILREVTKSFLPDLMPSVLWQRLGLTTQSLPDHLRPGKHAR